MSASRAFQLAVAARSVGRADGPRPCVGPGLNPLHAAPGSRARAPGSVAASAQATSRWSRRATGPFRLSSTSARLKLTCSMSSVPHACRRVRRPVPGPQDGDLGVRFRVDCGGWPRREPSSGVPTHPSALLPALRRPAERPRSRAKRACQSLPLDRQLEPGRPGVAGPATGRRPFGTGADTDKLPCLCALHQTGLIKGHIGPTLKYRKGPALPRLLSATLR